MGLPPGPGGNWTNFFGVDPRQFLRFMKRERRRTEKALVLTGGGALGAFQVGAIRRLFETGYQPDVICGISVGAINAAKLAEGGNAHEELYDMWTQLADGSLRVTDEFAGATEVMRRLTAWLTARVWEIAAAANLPPIIDAITAGVHAASTFEAIDDEIFKNLRWLHALGSVGESAPNGFAGLRELIRNNIRPDRIRESGIKLRVGMVDLESGSLWQGTEPRPINIPEPDGTDVSVWCSQLLREPDLSRDSGLRDVPRWIRIEDAVYASTVMPVYFPPLLAFEETLRDGSVFVDCRLPNDFRQFLRQEPNPAPDGAGAWRHFFDGGLADIVPIRTAMRMGCREITVIGVSPLHMASWRATAPNAADPLTMPAFQYFGGFVNAWALNVARSDMTLALAANEFLGWLYRLHKALPRDMAERVRNDFETYVGERGGVISNLLGTLSWFGGAGADGAVRGLNQPFYDEGCIIRVIAPTEPLPLDTTEFTNAVGIREARDIGARRMEQLLARPEEMTLSHPVKDEEILTAAQAEALGMAG